MKKINRPEDIFETKCWVNDIIADPYQVFAELFFSFNMHHLRNFVKRTIECCISNGVYKDKPAADVLLYSRMIHSVIKTAAVLKEKKRTEIDVESNDLLNPKYFASNHLLCDDWTDFPRFLSKKEYCNPYSVFKKFFKYQSPDQWLIHWRNIIDGALCPEEARFFINELSIYTHLVKLIEAAHLIDLRETVHIRGSLKDRNKADY